MQKRKYAQLMTAVSSMEQLQQKGLEGLVNTLSVVFSTIATIDPELALNSLEQLNGQKKEIKKFAADREKAHKKNIDMLMTRLPNVIELDDYEDEIDQEEEE